MTQRRVKVQLLGKEYSVNCPDGHSGQLGEVIAELERRIGLTQRKTMLQSNENILIMTALNMASDLLEQKTELERLKNDPQRNIS